MKFLNKIDGADKVITDSSNRFVTDTEKNNWNGKVDASQVLTDVPANAVFTDTNTVTSINGKTGAITKDDIVALGIPAQDTNTVYSHPSTHPASMITDLPTSLPADGGNADTVDGKHYSDIVNYVDSGRVPNLTLNELTLGGRFKIVYNDIEDSLDFEVI